MRVSLMELMAQSPLGLGQVSMTSSTLKSANLKTKILV